MDGNEDFRRFLDLLLADITAAGWYDPDAVGPAASLTDDIAAPHRVTPPTPTDPPDEPDGDESAMRRALATVVADGGTATLARPGSAAVRALLDPAARDEVRRTARDLVAGTDAYRAELEGTLPASTSHEVVLAVLLSLLHGPRWGAALTRLRALLAWYERAIALSVVITVDRPRRDAPEHDTFRDLRRALRRGRNRLSATVRGIVDDTAHVQYTHQELVERQLTTLAESRADWQRRQLVARQAGIPPPSPTDLAAYRRQRELTHRRTDLRARLGTDRAERTALRRITGSSTESREARRDARARLAVLWPQIQERQRELMATNREIATIRRSLGTATIRRITAYLDAERRGLRDGNARRDRDEMLARMDAALGPLTSHRLLVDDDTGRWRRYELLLDRLLRNSYTLGVELFMDSFLKVCSAVERRRDIGIAAMTTGHVQWLSYPGHGDDAVDWNLHAGLPLLVSAPTEFTLPERYRATPADTTTYRLTGASAVVEARGSDDIQDIFGKIAYGLLGRHGSRQRDLAALLREHGDEEIAPPVVLTRTFRGNEVTRLLTGLVARNLTPIDNADAFDALRAGIVRDIETLVVRARDLPTGTVLFRRDRLHADSGAFGLGRIVTNIERRDLLTSVRDLLSGDHTSPFDSERHRLVNRIWRLLLWLRSAGADDHRHAASISVGHVYRGSAPEEVTVRVYYSHMYDLAVRTGTPVRVGDQLGLTGSTGSAVNSHVHVEIFLSRGGSQLGACLPHEFFPLRS